MNYTFSQRVILSQKYSNRSHFHSLEQLEKNLSRTQAKRSFSSSPTRLGGPKLLDLIKRFPSGVKKLYNDYQTYQNINDAVKTKYNAWSKLDHHIPRRQQEQQKRLLRDLKKVALPVSIAVLPAVGNFFVALFAISPRPFLSDHFFTQDQVRYYASKEYYRKRKYFSSCARDIWLTILPSSYYSSFRPNDDMINGLDIKTYDHGGPVFGNVMELYNLFQNHFDHEGKSHSFPREQMLNIAFSTWLASPTLWIQPSILIRRRLASLARDIILDDISLIREKHHQQQCKSLTDNEVLEACLMRSLPCGMDQNFDAMRESLSNYLEMMAQLLNNVNHANLKNIEMTQFVVHLPAIRYQFSKEHGNKSLQSKS